MDSTPQLILASASPRRRELLSLLDLPFTVQPAHIDETPYPHESPAPYVQRMSHEKAQALRAKLTSSNTLVLTADTTVTIDEQILGKPADAAEATQMLQTLRDRTHQVFTSLTLLNTKTGEAQHELCESPVYMRPYTDEEMQTYIASGNPMDKAGAYAIQHPEFHPVENFSHCFASVMGLPLCHLARALKQSGLTPAVDVPRKCQEFLNYTCPIHHTILS